jgi:hypothetical protein
LGDGIRRAAFAARFQWLSRPTARDYPWFAPVFWGRNIAYGKVSRLNLFAKESLKSQGVNAYG